jgi:signal transduction histidine kinase
MVDAVAVISANGAVWLAPTAREALFDDVTDVDVASLLAAAHRDDRDRVVTALLAVLDGEERRVTWRYRHPARGWRRLASLLSPLPFVVNEPKLAVVLSLDITDDIVLDGVDRMDVQLAERERIARDLHDDALQQLAGLRWILIGRDTDADVLEELDAVDASIRGQLAQLHSAVARFGLERALLQLFDHVATPVTWEWPNGVLDTLPLDAAEVLFRSAREALRNVDQHARASAAELVIDVRPRRVVLTVHDDGVGVEPRGVVAAGRAGHLGVSSMREAALAAGGRFELAGRNAGGTRLRLELPLP